MNKLFYSRIFLYICTVNKIILITNILMMEIKKTKYPIGTTSEVAKRLKISTCTVSDVLNNKRSSSKTAEILQATAKFVAEIKAKEREARDQLSAVMNQ